MSTQELTTKLNISMGFCATGHSLADVALFFNRTKSGVFYWKNKVIQKIPSLPHGGARVWKFTGEDRTRIEQAVFDFVKSKDGLAQRKEILSHLKSLGVTVSLMFISRICHAYGILSINFAEIFLTIQILPKFSRSRQN